MNSLTRYCGNLICKESFNKFSFIQRRQIFNRINQMLNFSKTEETKRFNPLSNKVWSLIESIISKKIPHYHHIKNEKVIDVTELVKKHLSEGKIESMTVKELLEKEGYTDQHKIYTLRADFLKDQKDILYRGEKLIEGNDSLNGQVKTDWFARPETDQEKISALVDHVNGNKGNFLSTTPDQKVAESFAASSKKPGKVFIIPSSGIHSSKLYNVNEEIIKNPTRFIRPGDEGLNYTSEKEISIYKGLDNSHILGHVYQPNSETVSKVITYLNNTKRLKNIPHTIKKVKDITLNPEFNLKNLTKKD